MEKTRLSALAPALFVAVLLSAAALHAAPSIRVIAGLFVRQSANVAEDSPLFMDGASASLMARFDEPVPEADLRLEEAPLPDRKFFALASSPGAPAIGRPVDPDESPVMGPLTSLGQFWEATSLASLRERIPLRAYEATVVTDVENRFEVDLSAPFSLPAIILSNADELDGVRDPSRPVRVEWTYSEPLEPEVHVNLSIHARDGGERVFSRVARGEENVTTMATLLEPGRSYFGMILISRFPIESRSSEDASDAVEDDAVSVSHTRLFQFAIGGDPLPVEPEAPAIARHPASVAAAPGERVALGVLASGTPRPTYQWLKDGEPIPGATRPNYAFEMSEMAQGAYRVEVENEAGLAGSEVAEISVGLARGSAGPRLVNLSSRARVSSGARQAISGFVIEGSQPMRVLLRGVGPALRAQAGLAGALTNPKIVLHGPEGRLAKNDDWAFRPDADVVADRAKALGAFSLDRQDGRDAVLYATLQPGAYTVLVSGRRPGAQGLGLVEVYEDTRFPTDSRLVNLSTRAHVGKGAEVAIGGFVVDGDQPRSYLLRGAGPDLAARGVEGFLPDPAIRLFDASGAALADSDDWDPALADAFADAGADPFEPGSRDAALLVELDPGPYTVHLRSAKEGAGGIGLVEIFEVLK